MVVSNIFLFCCIFFSTAIIIGFEEPVYLVNEGESVMVCINVSNPPVEFPLSLSAPLLLSGTPIPGSAGKWLLFFYLLN